MTCHVGTFSHSVSSLFFGIAVSAVFVVPVGIITAVANTEVTLNVLAEFVGGAAYPGISRRR